MSDFLIGRDDFRAIKQREFDKKINHAALGEYREKLTTEITPYDAALLELSRKKNRDIPSVAMSLPQAKELLWRVVCDYCSERDFVFELNDTNKKILQLLVAYMTYQKDSVLDPRKGILFVGGTGCGKTTLMRILQRYAKLLSKFPNYDHYFHIESAKNVVNDARFNTSNTLYKYQKDNYCFDDFGFEPSDAKVWGNNLTVMGDILAERYDRFVLGGQRTHITTNLNEKEIEEKYGQRIFSRMNEMFNWIVLTGKDYRI